jgi:hypothetical protein
MYKINPDSGNVYRISDNKLVSPANNTEDPDFLEYNAWANKGNHPEEDLIYIKSKRQKEVWELIKIERERKKFSGIKVGDHWFHTDSDSRIQQLGLVNAAAVNAIPPGFMWKTLTPAGGLFEPVFVEMTNDLARNIFFHTMIHDGMFHNAGEAHREAMLVCEDPTVYNYESNWPLNFEQYQKDYLNTL